jgi:hypothetical protein
VNHARQQRGAPPEVEGAGEGAAVEGKLSENMSVRAMQRQEVRHDHMRS